MASWQAAAGATLVVLVNLSTVREGAEHDPTCLLEPGCHPFVKQRSFVVYRSARLEPAAHVEQLVKQGFFKPQPAVNEGMLALVKVGLRSSPFTKREFKQLDLS